MAQSEVRVTLPVVMVLGTFMEHPDEGLHGYSLMQATGFSSGKMYPILSKLEKANWIDRIEPTPDDRSDGPPRVTYKLSSHGVGMAYRELDRIRRSVSLPQPSRPPQTKGLEAT